VTFLNRRNSLSGTSTRKKPAIRGTAYRQLSPPGYALIEPAPPISMDNASGAVTPADKLGRMNPRYRRLVIPGALTRLILIMVLGAMLRR